MVVLSVALATKNGKTLVARQFVEMTRIRIEGLLAAFPKLMGSDNKQHTYIETESVRYVYHPMEHLYLLLITNRASNIVEDLETLRLLSKVIPDVVGSSTNLNEEKILEHVYDLIFAFDEVITAGGYRESVTVSQIRTFMEMDSHEEKLQNMIKSSKMENARDQAKDAARLIKERGMKAGGVTAMGSSSSTNSAAAAEMDRIMEEVKKPVTPAVTHAPVKGMDILSKSENKNKSLFDALVKEEKLTPIIPTTSKSSSVVETVAASTVQHPITLQSVEKVTATLTRDGDVQSVEVKGNLTLTAVDDAVANCVIQLAVNNGGHSFTFNTHPKVNKALYDKSQILSMKDTKTGFPAQRPVGILRWSNSQSSSEFLPITINCWPEEESKNKMLVTIDYSVPNAGSMSLHDVQIRIPINSMEAPNIKSIDGRYKHNKTAGELVWEIDLIDGSNSTGNLEFTIAEKNTDAFFPINVNFSSKQMYCSVDVISVRAINPGDDAVNAASSGAPLMFGYSTLMQSEEYLIE